MMPLERNIEVITSKKCEEENQDPISPNIQSQISIFEKEIESTSRTFCRRPSSPPLIPNRRNKFETLETFFMTQSSSSTNLSNYKQQGIKSSNSSVTEKFKSCSNLRSTTINNKHQKQNNQALRHQLNQQHHPGALVVKQMFIEPPKRITTRFGHSKTKSIDCDFHFYDTSESRENTCNSDNVSGCCPGVLDGSQSLRTSPRPPQRFTTTKIDETFHKKDDANY